MRVIKRVKRVFLFLVLLVFIVLGCLYLFRNYIVSSIFEASAESLFAAKAEMSGCDLQLFSGKLIWEDFQVADKGKPMKNLFQTGCVELDFNISALLKGQIVCTNLLLEKLRFGTERSTSGLLPKNEKNEESSKVSSFVVDYLQKQKRSVPILTYQKMNVDSVLATYQLITPNKVDSLQKAVKQMKDSWTKLLNDKDFTQKSKNIQKKFNSLDFDEPAKALKELEKLYKEGNFLYQESQEQRSNFEKQYKVLKTANKLEEWVKEDYNRVMQAVKFPDTQGYKMGEILFGSTVYDIILQVISMAKTSRNSMDATKPKSEQKLRFWLKEVQFNTLMEDSTWVKGEISNVSNAQKLTGKTTDFDIMLTTAKKETIDIKGKLDYTKKVSKESFLVDLKGINLDNIKLNQDVLPPRISSGFLDGDVSCLIEGDEIRLKSALDLKDIVYSYEYEKKVSKQMQEIAKLVGKSASDIWVKVDFRSNNSAVKTSIKSSLDMVIKKALYNKFSSEKKELEKKLQKKIAKGKHQKDLDLLFKAFDQDVASILLKESPISEKQKDNKKGFANNLLKQGEKILEDNGVKDKAKELLKGLKF